MNMEQIEKKSSDINNDIQTSKTIKFLVILLFLYSLVPIAIYVIYFRNYPISNETSDWSSFMSYSTSFMSIGVGLIGTFLVYLTYKSTHENAKKTAQIAEESIKNSRIQQFEGAFFNLLQNQNHITNNLKNEILVGKEFIDAQAKSISNGFSVLGIENIKVSTDVLFGIYSTFIDITFSQYFRHLYNIIKYVDESKIGKEKQKKYIDIIQAQLTDNELLILSINCMKEPGVNKFRPLLDKYQFLRNVRSIGYGFDEILKEHYPQTKFKYHKSLPHGN